ncbi:non-canonical purine NTP pyrophosphatase [bacterium]|nr:non-canonical purine NTP pyrophosphatase [bacterium]
MIVIASRNEHKIAEIQALPAADGLELKPISEFEGAPVIDEPGTTCEENSAIKAVKQSLWLKRELGIEPPVIAEDSGLEIESLMGWPGTQSARIAKASSERIIQVLERLGESANRSAQFVAHTALAINGHLIRTWRGVAQGRIVNKSRGSSGFGYDPVFEDLELKRTYAQLSTEEKNERSHRAKAWNQALAYLRSNKFV